MVSSINLDPLIAFASADSFVKMAGSSSYNFIATYAQFASLRFLFDKYITLAPTNRFKESLQAANHYIPTILKVVVLTGIVGYRDKQKSRIFLYATNEKLHKLLLVAYVVATIALVPLSPITAVPMLGTFAYHALDQRKMIPERISSFMRKYGQAVGAFVSLFQQSYLIKLFAVSRLMDIFNIQNNAIFSWLDRVVKPAHIASLAQIDDKSNFKLDSLTEDQITKALSGNPLVLNVNYSMATRNFHKFTKIEPNQNYDDFLSLFESFGTDSEALHKLFGTNREWADQFNVDRKRRPPLFGNNFDTLLEELAAKKNVSPEEYLNRYIKKSMQKFVSQMKGEMKFQGLQEDLEIVKRNSAIILAYLQRYQSAEDTKKIFHMLCNFAVGNQLQMLNLRFATDILRSQLYQLELKNEQNIDGPIYDVYELNLLRNLEISRKKTVDDCFQPANSSIFPEFVISDLKIAFGFGFVPLPKGKRQNLGFQHFLEKLAVSSSWKFSCMTESVKCVSQMDPELTKEKIFQIINESALADERKAALLKEYQNSTEESGIRRKYNNLILVKLGILTVV